MANYNLAKVLIQQRRFEEASLCVKRLVELFPKRSALRFNLARTLEETGDLEGAVVAYKEA